jgi:GT2 family glycosyltransferase
VPVAVVALAENVGFAGGMNEALARTEAPFVLSLNPDARPEPGYAGALLARLVERPTAAAATGRLVRFPSPGEPPRLDACGMRLTWTWRHLDRGSGEVDRGQYARPERVFGATGAASLFRRRALDDVAVLGEVFERRFHSFREDAELAFRLAERGWDVIYEPEARAWHRRAVLPRGRRALPAAVNYHSVKNRYLLRAYHQTAGNFLLTFLPALWRDLSALAYVVFLERSSLGAYRWLWENRREIVRRRLAIQARRNRPGRAIDRWFFRAGSPL